MLDRTDVKFFKLAVQDNIRNETAVDISAMCPVCGDSHRGNKARLHLYTKGQQTLVNCFNGGCPVENRIVYTFLRDFFPEFLEAYKRETFGTRMQQLQEEFGTSNNKTTEITNAFANLGNSTEIKDDDFFTFNEGVVSKAAALPVSEDRTASSVFSNLKKEVTVENEVLLEPKKESAEFFYEGIEPKDKIETLALGRLFEQFEDSPAEEYLNSRLVGYNPEITGKYYYSPGNIQLDNDTLYVKESIIVPLYYKNRIYGFYSRRIKESGFFTFIWKNTGYKIWNYFNVKPKPVYVFEGIFDALSTNLDNVVASMGAKIPDERLRDLKDYCKEVIFVLDADRTGLMNSLDYVRKGCSVYIPPNRESKDMNDMLKSGASKQELSDLIINNVYKGILAEVKIKQLL